MFKSKMVSAKSAMLAVIISTISMSSSAAVINLNYNQSDFSSAQGQQALAGFQDAASYWSNMFDDTIDVNLNIAFTSLGSNVLGQTSSSWSNFYYQDVKDALGNNQTSALDASAYANLSCDNQGNGQCSRSFLDEEGGVTTLDNDGSPDNFVMSLTQANAKALGFLSDSFGTAFNAVDAVIKFSSDFAFDFDSSDGIASNKMDFTGVAIHEIGHALGFTSSVDTFDYINNNQGGSADLDGYAVFSALDLFRYSTESLSYGQDVLDLRPGADSFFSVDGGLTSLGDFSTGVYGGDGNQASHWLDDSGLGIMDPTFAYGQLGEVTALDLAGFDAIGWDLSASQEVVNPTPPSSVPLPSTFGLFGLAFIGFMSRRKQASKV